MAEPKIALLAFGKLIGVLDTSGSFNWIWFTNPLREALSGMSSHRENLGYIIRALLERQPYEGPSPAFGTTPGHVWESYSIIPSSLDIGLVWNTSTSDPFRLGLGAHAAFGTDPLDIDLTLLARLVQFPGGPASNSVNQLLPGHELGQVSIAASLPTPDFLSSATLGVEIPGSPIVNLTVADPAGNRSFPEPSAQIVWDCARLAVFVLRAWVRKKALDSAGQDNFFTRANNHLFPMLGDPASAIHPFPLLTDPAGTVPSFNDWADSIFTLDQNAQGALIFLWHLRALATGNESQKLWDGSVHLPLISAAQEATGSEQIFGFTKVGNYPADVQGKGVFLGVVGSGLNKDLVVDFKLPAVPPVSVVLAHFAGGTVTLPTLPGAGDFTALQNTLQSFNNFSTGDGSIQVQAISGGIRVSLFKRTASDGAVAGISGEYSLNLVLRSGQKIAFSFDSPFGELELPPTAAVDGPAILMKIVKMLLEIVPVTPGSTEELVINSLKTLVEAAFKGQTPDPIGLAMAVLSAAGTAGALEVFEPLTLSLGTQADGKYFIEPGLILGPFQLGGDESGESMSIGKFEVKARAAFNAASPSVEVTKASLAFSDVRFGQGAGSGGQATGLVGSLLPDMKQVPGFALSVSVNPATLDFEITGGGKIPLQQSIGPLDLAGLLIDIRKDSLAVGVDLSFELATITVSAYELGVKFTYNGAKIEPFLHGLGLSMDMSPVKLAGMFAGIKQPGSDAVDYVGGAVVSIAGYFELSAIGGYTQLPGDKASLFIFASLVAPLGGPPWFFITGVAGGFGYNRSLPPPGLLTEHPFIQVMRGDIEVSADAAAGLAGLSKYFAPVDGQYWVAAGIQFNAFGFINGKVVVAVAFGNKFSIQVLGLASFGIESIAYFEIGIEASANEEQFKLKAGISKNSYIIDPEIFSIHGDFALGIWHSGEHKGDFVLSIGGYHPYFDVPAHYDELNRVGVTCVIYGFVRLSVECFFACTPQAIMAGASITLAAEFEGIGAGLDVYIDVFMRWDPFYIRASMGITLWFEFLGRHEIGVSLQIWTPPFGGIATIDLAIVSFDVEFGEEEDHNNHAKLHEVLSKQLGVPATHIASGAKASAYNTPEKAGMFRVDFTSGRTTQPQEDTAEQEGISAPLPMNTEFGYTVKSRLPLANPDPIGSTGLSGEVHLPLCDAINLASELTTTITGSQTTPLLEEMLPDFFPAATFGEKLPLESQADGARNAVHNADPEATVARVEGFAIKVTAELPSPPAITSDAYENSGGENEDYPLPLASQNIYWRPTKQRLAFKTGWAKLASTPVMGRRQSAALAIKNYTTKPLIVSSYTADLQRFPIQAKLSGLTVAAPPTDAPIIAVPSSPVRRAELLPVNLRVMEPKAPFTLKRQRLTTLTRARNLATRALTPRGGTTSAFRGAVGVAVGKAVMLELAEGKIRSQKLAITGQQMVRAIFVGGGGDYLSTAWLLGSASVVVPTRARRLVLIGEGTTPPVSAPAGSASLPPAALENIGVEHDTTMLALSARTYAGHGCVVQSGARLPLTAKVMDSLPGFEFFRGASNFTVHFPPVGKGMSLILSVAPRVRDAGTAIEEVRWAAMDANVTELTTIVGPQSTSFVMTLDAPTSWMLEVDVSRKWRVTAVVAARRTARDNVNLLRRQISQDLIDDRLEIATAVQPSNAVLEVGQ